MKLDLDRIMIPPPQPGETLDFAEMFGNDHPVEMELGCGKGGFLLERARSMPECNFFAVEWSNKYCRFAADRMARWGVANVRLMRTDGGHLVRHHLPGACLTAMHLYHPDPWPKKRHHKRRVFQPPFVVAVVRVLRPGGRLYVQTDHQEYFIWIMDLLKAESGLITKSAGLLDPDSPDGSPGTNYEIKYLREGRSIWSLVAMRP